MFITKEISADGKYKLKVYENDCEKIIEIDDFFPCYSYTVSFNIIQLNPCCCQLLINKSKKEKYIWPLLVEKAIAKVYGSYNNLNGGGIDYAIMMITGKPTFRYNLLNEEIQMRLVDNSLWIKLLDFVNKGYLLGAGTLPIEEIPEDCESISGRHAYSIIDAFELDGIKLIQLIDPRGVSNWFGKWSNPSSEWPIRLKIMAKDRWQENLKNNINKPLLGVQTSSLAKKQYIFFMSWEEFQKCFEVIFATVLFDDSWSRIIINGKREANYADRKSVGQ